MKDEKGHGSDSHGAHSEGVVAAGRAAAFNVSKQVHDKLNADWSDAHAKLKAVGSGSGAMGLTPDSVKASPEYRAAKSAADAAGQRARNFNGQHAKQFAPELKAERDRKYGR